MVSLDDFKNKKTETKNQIFNDGVYTVYSEKIDQLKKGDTIYLTTSDLEYDCIYGCFMTNLRKHKKVEVEIIYEDLSEYVPEKSRTGGCYAYASAKVIDIIGE